MLLDSEASPLAKGQITKQQAFGALVGKRQNNQNRKTKLICTNKKIRL